MEQFFCKTKIVSGAGALAVLGTLSVRRLFLVSDPFFVQNGQAQAVLEAAGCAESQIFSDVVPDPSIDLAAKGALLVRQFAPDTVVALGGGSAIDCAKAMVYFSGLSPKLIAVPTTSGSGSEVTDFAVLTHHGVKYPLVDERIRPDVAVVDGDLVAALPRALIADGGFDLISHALEASVATGASPLSDLFAGRALETALSQLQASYEGDQDARRNIHLAATMAGIAFSSAGLGLCHALSHALGGEFHLPHGRLNAIVLPAVVEANAAADRQMYAALARKLGLSAATDVLAVRSLKAALLRLRRNLRLPQTLAEAGVSPAIVAEKADDLVAAALADPCCKTNPVAPDEAMVRRILDEVTGHG